jgi:GGDEF domain-containing protein
MDLRIDPTTGLAVLTETSLGALRNGSVLAYVDLVHSRDRVNAPFGHVACDSAPAAVGLRLTDGLAPWRVFRSAGDEFTVEVASPLVREAAASLADQIDGILAGPFEEMGEGLEATVGICLRAVDDDPFAARTWRRPLAGCPSG